MGQAVSARLGADGAVLFEVEVRREAAESQWMRGGWCRSTEGLGCHQEEAHWDAQHLTKTVSEHLSVFQCGC